VCKDCADRLPTARVRRDNIATRLVKFLSHMFSLCRYKSISGQLLCGEYDARKGTEVREVPRAKKCISLVAFASGLEKVAPRRPQP